MSPQDQSSNNRLSKLEYFQSNHEPFVVECSVEGIQDLQKELLELLDLYPDVINQSYCGIPKSETVLKLISLLDYLLHLKVIVDRNNEASKSIQGKS